MQHPGSSHSLKATNVIKTMTKRILLSSTRKKKGLEQTGTVVTWEKKERREKEKKECDVMRGVCVEIDYVRI